MSHTYRKNSKGFTLIEVLVAVTLTAILLTSLYGAFFSITGTGKDAAEGIEGYIEAGRFLERFTSEVHSAYTMRDKPVTVFRGERRGDRSSITFTTFTHPYMSETAPMGDMTGVSYFIEKRDGGGLVLMKEVWNPYTNERFKAEATGEIEGFELSYYNGSTWSKAWDSTLEGGSPKAVKAALKLKGGEEVFAISRTMIR